MGGLKSLCLRVRACVQLFVVCCRAQFHLLLKSINKQRNEIDGATKIAFVNLKSIYHLTETLRTQNLTNSGKWVLFSHLYGAFHLGSCCFCFFRLFICAPFHCLLFYLAFVFILQFAHNEKATRESYIEGINRHLNANAYSMPFAFTIASEPHFVVALFSFG